MEVKPLKLKKNLHFYLKMLDPQQPEQLLLTIFQLAVKTENNTLKIITDIIKQFF